MSLFAARMPGVASVEEIIEKVRPEDLRIMYKRNVMVLEVNLHCLFPSSNKLASP